MPTYNFLISASSPTGLTDLELSDVCLHIIDCLDHPVAEMVDGSYGQADYSFEAYTLEAFEETGDRVWLYTLNAADPREVDSHERESEPTPPAGAPSSLLRRLFGRRREND